jgi:hypothetical protein
MPGGLQVFNADGSLQLDISDSLSKIVGAFNIAANVAGSVGVPDLAGGSRIFIMKQAQPPLGIAGVNQGRSQITISGRTISWTAGRDNVTVYYGVY